MFLAIMPALHLWPAAEHRQARLAQSAERKALNLVVVGSSPTVGAFLLFEIVLGFNDCVCSKMQV